MKKTAKKNSVLSLIIAFCILVAIAALAFALPYLTGNRLADAFDREGISYTMTNAKDSWYALGTQMSVNEAEEDLKASYSSLQGVNVSLKNFGAFTIYLAAEEGEEAELILGQYYVFSSGFNNGRDEVFAALQQEKQDLELGVSIVLKGRYLFRIAGEEIPAQLDRAIESLGGSRQDG